jgi:hypothetical protein
MANRFREAIRRSFFLSVATATLSCSACASFSTLKTPRAIDPGTHQLTAAVDLVAVPIAAAGSTTNAPQLAPQIEIAGRWGVVEGFDLGAKLWNLGGEVSSTISLLRSPSLDLAIAPSIGLQEDFGVLGYQTSCPSQGCGPQPNGLVLFGKLPLLMGVPLGFGHQLVFGPEAVAASALDNSAVIGSANRVGLLVGGAVGISVKLTPHLRMMPEVTVLTPAIGFFSPQISVLDRFGQPGSVLFQGALGFSFGNDGYGSR